MQGIISISQVTPSRLLKSHFHSSVRSEHTLARLHTFGWADALNGGSQVIAFLDKFFSSWSAKKLGA